MRVRCVSWCSSQSPYLAHDAPLHCHCVDSPVVGWWLELEAWSELILPEPRVSLSGQSVPVCDRVSLTWVALLVPRRFPYLVVEPVGVLWF